MGGPVFPEIDRIVGPDVQHRHPSSALIRDRAAAVIGEDQKARGVRPRMEAPCRSPWRHSVLPYAEMQIAAPVIPSTSRRLELIHALEGEPGLRRRREVRGAAQHRGDPERDRVECLRRGVAAGDALGIGREGREVAVPAGRKHVSAASSRVVGPARGYFFLYAAARAVPLGPSLGATPAEVGREVLPDTIGYDERRVGIPPVEFLREPDLVRAERLAMGLARVLPMGRPVADVAVHDDEGRPVGVARKVSYARVSMSRSLASLTRVTLHPYARNGRRRPR